MNRPPRSRAGRKGSLAPPSPSLTPAPVPPLNGFSLTTDPPHSPAPLPPPPKLKSKDTDKTPPSRSDKALKSKKAPTSTSPPSPTPPHPSNGSSKARPHDPPPTSPLIPSTSIKRKSSASPSPTPPTKVKGSGPPKGKEGKEGKGLGVFEVYSPLVDPVTGETLFCVCRRANDGEAMICCDVCEEWYHLRCIGLTAQEVARLEHFVCARCRLDPVRGKEENRKRKRMEEDRKGKPPPSSSVTTGEKRVRRRDRNGVDGAVEGRGEEEDMGDGSGEVDH